MTRPDVAEIQSLNGEDCRVISAGLMPELARAAKAEGFRAKMWVAPGYVPRRVEITQPDFVAVTDIKDLRFSPSLPASTWQPPADVTDIYWTNSEMLDSVLFVVMNSLKMTEGDQPWLSPDERSSAAGVQNSGGVDPPRTFRCRAKSCSYAIPLGRLLCDGSGCGCSCCSPVCAIWGSFKLDEPVQGSGRSNPG